MTPGGLDAEEEIHTRSACDYYQFAALTPRIERNEPAVALEFTLAGNTGAGDVNGIELTRR